MADQPLVSVVIVNYKVPDFVRQAVQSLKEARLYDRTEIIVVDNASGDNSRELVLAANEDVRWIGLKSNIGFGKACNVGAQNARGAYLLFLNPDTVVQENTLRECVDFMDSHEDVGIVGPKIINPDGSLQESCHRSFPTPFNTFSYLFGLSSLFPKSKLFGQYNLTYLDENESADVDAISGSFMFVRSNVFRDIGGFDEAFFMYGEDLDLCARVREAGYTVWYHPATQIIHFKGKSSAKKILRSRVAFYEAMVLFSRKYRPTYGAFFPRWLVIVGIALKAGVNMIGTLMASGVACLIDLLIINSVLWAGMTIRFMAATKPNPYASGQFTILLLMHGLMSLSFLLTYAIQGRYSRDRYTPSGALVSGLLASMIFVVGIYFAQSMAYSRITFAVAGLVISFALVGWRELVPRIPNRIKRLVFQTGRMIIVGCGPVATLLIRKAEQDQSAHITGIIWPTREGMPGEFEGYPVLGSLENVRQILAGERVDQVLVATSESWYSHFIEALALLKLRHLTIRWVPRDILKQDPEGLPEEIPLEDFKV